jgi:hypothetical protein
MKPSDLTVYAVSPHGTPIRYTTEATLVPLCAHATTLEKVKRQELEESGWLFDDYKDNISTLNPWFAELTGIFTIIHYGSPGLIGNAQYRRRWKEDALAPSDENMLYVPGPAIFGCSVAEQMAAGHSSFDGRAMMLEATTSWGYPLGSQDIEKVLNQNYFYGCLMARGPSDQYKIFMKMLLRCLTPIWRTHKEQIMKIEGYDRRAMAFIAERMMTALIMHRGKLFDFEIMSAPIEFIGP